MLRALITFELRRRLKLLSTWVYAAVLFAAGAFLMAATAGLFKAFSASGGSERVYANGPFSVYGTTNVVALLGLFTVAAVFGQAAQQDFAHGTWVLVFTRNVRKGPYLAGRFLGAFIFAALLFLAIGAGQLAAALVAQVVDASRLGPHRLDVYLWPFLVSVWPMLFVTGAVFFSLAALTRAMAPVYVGVVVLVLGYLVLSVALGDVQNQTLGALADPFGALTFDVVTRYWTPAERNRDLVPLWGLLGLNRLLWGGAAAGLLAFTAARFRTTVEEQRGRAPAPDDEAAPTGPLPRATPVDSGWWRTALATAWLYFRDVLRSPVYWALVAAGLLFVLLGVLVAKDLFGTATLPVTWQVLELAGGTFSLFSLITITFYAGELAWKERDAGLADLIDASRVPTWVPFTGKLLALLVVAASLQGVVGLAALTAQVSRGFFDVEWRLYAAELLLFGALQDVLVCVLALTAQVVLRHKYLGHGVMVLFFVSQAALQQLGVEERLVRFASEPLIPYSDLNGYGHWLPVTLAWRTYWYAVALVLVAGAYLVVPRGRSGARRVQVARSRLSRPWVALAALGGLLAVGLGGFLFRQTHLERPFVTAKDRQRARADYEKRWKAWATKPQPRIIDADVRLDVYPEELPPRLHVRGALTLRNTTDAGIGEVLVTLPDDARVNRLAVADVAAPTQHDAQAGVRVYALPAPLAPGAQAHLVMDLEYLADPWVHGERRDDVVGNGTFFANTNLPALGYYAAAELTDEGDRRSWGLPPRSGMPEPTDPAALQHNAIRPDSDRIGFRATVSTAPDQVAVVPGTLTREWRDGGRRFFRYELEQPVLNFFSVLSARYEVREDTWNDVRLQVFFDPSHPFNVDRMLSGMKDALTYCSEAFGPYQHRELRILEFPRYHSFAQAFPGTIPYSEALGFIARVREGHPDDLDYPYYVTAHEVAHQWWAHQVTPADTKGATMTTETLAQYSALMVMKKRYGADRMRRFLKYELDRYLVGRALERRKEVPLARVEHQAYIHYQKGSLAMYALQELAGEATVNRALKKYVEAVRFRGPPYTTSLELLSYLRAELPPEQHPVLVDLFETITLYDNRALAASMRQNAAGGWDVTVRVKAVKYRADEQGEQTEVDFADLMDVGALDEEGRALHLEKRRLEQGEAEVRFTVPSRPARVGVDPMNLLIDRTSDDNTVAPTVEG